MAGMTDAELDAVWSRATAGDPIACAAVTEQIELRAETYGLEA